MREHRKSGHQTVYGTMPWDQDLDLQVQVVLIAKLLRDLNESFKTGINAVPRSSTHKDRKPSVRTPRSRADMRFTSKIVARELGLNMKGNVLCREVLVQRYSQGSLDLVGREIRSNIGPNSNKPACRECESKSKGL